MKPCLAVIYLALLMTSSLCDDESDESDSDEYFPAIGCSQECRQAAQNDLRTRIKAQSNSQDSFNFTIKGSHIAVTTLSQAHQAESERSSAGNRRTGQNSNRKNEASISSHWVISNAPSDRPFIEVHGNGRMRTQRPTIRTTIAPESVDSNGLLGGNLEKVGQATGQEASSLPSPPNCGISLTDRITGGMKAENGKWLWLVAYGYRDKRTAAEDHLWMCGGSLVTEKHTITVAHCAIISTHFIDVARIGDVYLNSTLDETSIAEQRNVNKKIILHPNYNKSIKKHDIAIVTLKKPFSHRYKPICLPFRMDMRTKKFVTKEAYVAGWGATDYTGSISNGLLGLKLPIVDNEVCRGYYALKNVSIDDDHICAGGEAGKDACRGDSGGPLMVKNDGEPSYYLVGLVSFGSGCGNPGVPGVYTRITSYLDWLEEKLKT